MSDKYHVNFDNEFLTKRQSLWQWMNSTSMLNPFTSCGMFPGRFVLHLTPSGTAQGAEPSQPSSSGLQPACFPPMCWPPQFLPFFCTSARLFLHFSTWHRAVILLSQLLPRHCNQDSVSLNGRTMMGRALKMTIT